MDNSTKKYSTSTHEAVSMADAITPSILALARGQGVKPKVLAQWLVEAKANSLYRSEITKELIGVFVAQAVEQEVKAEEESR